MTLQEKLALRKAQIEENLPPEMVNIMHQSTQELAESGIQKGVLPAGVTSPPFQLSNQDNISISLDDYLAKGPLVITFYRGFWCPYCNIDLEHMNHYKEHIEKANATMIAISPELHKYSKKIIQLQQLNFDILHDKNNTLAEQFGLKFELPNALIDVYKQLKINLKLYNGSEPWSLPIPARFIIDTSGIIRYAESSVDYTNRPNPDELMNILNTL